MQKHSFKSITSRIFLKIRIDSYKNNPSQSSLMTLEVCGGVSERLYPLLVFSYFAVFGMFLGINIWAVVYSPQPITERRV